MEKAPCISVGDAKLPSLDVLVAFEDRQPWTKGKSWFLVSNAHTGLPGGDSGEARWASGETASALQYKPLHQPINPAALCTLVQLSIHSIVVQCSRRANNINYPDPPAGSCLKL